MTVKEKVIEIIAEQGLLEKSTVTQTSTLKDLGIDSMAIVESIFAIEEEFDIIVPFNANVPETSDFDVSSIGSIVRSVEILVAEQN